MATENKPDAKATASKKAVPKPVALEPRIHLTEFVASHPELSELQVAGIKALSGNKEWMRKAEWEKVLKNHTK